MVRGGKKRRPKWLWAMLLVVLVFFGAWRLARQLRGLSEPYRRPLVHTHSGGRLRGVKPVNRQSERKVVKPGGEKLVFKTKAEKADKIAIIIDDLGYDESGLALFSDISVKLTLAVLPKLRYSEWVAREASSLGFEVILHLPMEPENEGEDPGPGVITTEMGESEIKSAVEGDLKTVPQALGISNHMGSKASADRRVVCTVLGVARRHKLFFVDSLTTPDSLISEIGEEMGVPVLSRQVFLDNIADEEYIKGQMRKLMGYAHRDGKAIGIGHPRAATVEVILEMLPEIKDNGLEVVGLSELVD